MTVDTAENRIARARRYGFTAHAVPPRRFSAKSGSHDDGPGHGMFLGGIGAPVLSRDLDGKFSRWHLEPGGHVLAEVPQCVLGVHWRDRHGEHHRALDRASVDEYEVAGLYPMWHEVFRDADMPFRVLLTSFSPVIPGDDDTASLPVICFDVRVVPRAGEVLPAVDVALFWANLNGWQASTVTALDRRDRAWPGHHHAGNINRAARWHGPGTAVVQGREQDLRGPMTTVGEVCVSASGDAEDYSRQVQFKTDQNATGVPEHDQPYTFGAVWHGFATTGRLGTGVDGSWPAHWHEPVGSAVAAHHRAGKAAAESRFAVVFDWPDVVFGRGRAWRRRYTWHWSGPERAVSLAAHAQHAMPRWQHDIDAWHEGRIAALTDAGWPHRVAGCMLNETGLLASLGATWLRGTAPGHEPDGPLGAEEHFGLLEGFDTGYFYVNTSDLWHYGFPALTRTWPHLADLLFGDLSDALVAEDPRERPIYRLGESRAVLVADRLPHDMGAVHEDPFVRLNGYSMRDDPNTWRDANPAFVLATLVHHRLLGRSVDERTWHRLRAAADVVAADAGVVGAPRHDEFGDSTWDNLGLRGWSSYATGLCAGMWSVLAAEANRRGECDEPDLRRLRKAADLLESLWTGEHYSACSEGKYTAALMPDSLFGVFYAELAGGVPVLPRERIVRHLRAAYRIAYREYHSGRVGPLLIAEPGLPRYSQDGGEELQVNEVIIGSAWMFVAMLRWYGLTEEASAVATSLSDVLYGASGLQYRTPAAVDGDGFFRAPLNLRPLAVWWLDVVTEISARDDQFDPGVAQRTGDLLGGNVVGD